MVTVSSEAHRGPRIPWDDMRLQRRYFGWRAYGITKLANLLFTRELARRLQGTGITANALHPGVVYTELLARGFPPVRLFKRFLRAPEEGARTSVFLATSPEVEGITGRYWIDERPVDPSASARSDDDARRLWAWSEEQTRS